MSIPGKELMNKIFAGPFAALLLSVTAAPGLRAEEKRRAPEPRETPVAVVGKTPITAAKLEETIGSELMALRNQEHNLKMKALENLIAQTLSETEAAARGVSVEELFRIEVESKIAPVTENEKKAAYEVARERYRDRPETEAMKAIEEVLRQQRIRERGLEYLKELRTKAGVRVLLEPLRVAVDPSDDPSKGPASAPVTIVEFSDFQCSYCSEVSLTLKKVTERYGDKVRLVFRDFPLDMHKEAPKAAEAAACAHEQRKYWEMHDRLFANQANLKVDDLKRHAAEIGLKADRFNTCLDSGKYTAEWQEDMKEGTRYGVSSTPVFFINGRLLTGSQPIEAFARVIDEELGRLAPLEAAAARKP